VLQSSLSIGDWIMGGGSLFSICGVGRVGENLSVSSTFFAHSRVSVAAGGALQSGLSVREFGYFGSELSVFSGATVLGGSVSVQENASLARRLSVRSKVLVSSRVSVFDAVVIGNSLSVSSFVRFGSSLSIEDFLQPEARYQFGLS
jgi:hypothetical protein